MVRLQRSRDESASPRHGAGRSPEPGKVRELCSSLLGDIAMRERAPVLERLGRLRRASDLGDLRSVLFDLIALHHGEAVAHERLTDFDAGMTLHPPRDAWSPTVT